jgi:ribosomal protein L29
MADFSKQDIAELKKLLADKRETLRLFRFHGAGSRSRNVREGRETRKDVARLMTELRARELASTKKTA